MTTVIFESHATTFDNEQKIASGHYDVALSEKGVEQASELGRRRQDEHFDAIFCSDLKRSYMTATLAFGTKHLVYRDDRLRECDYGDFEHHPSSEIERVRPRYVHEPFPNGESYEQRAELMRSFLTEIQSGYAGKRVLVIGHRATQYGLERWSTGQSLLGIVSAPWHWQPGWVYEFTNIRN